MKESPEKNWDIVIRPKDKMLAIDWKEMWRYRDLYLLFVRRDIFTQYKQTILGPLWFLINPIMGMIVMVAVFGGVVGIDTGGIPPTLFYLLGPALWGYFSCCLSATSNSFLSNADIFGKVYFPRMIMPLVSVTVNLVGFTVQMLIFVAFYIYYTVSGTADITPNAVGLLFPVFVVMLALTAMGVGMLISSFSTKYRDVQMFLEYIVKLMIYLTPVIYPLSMVENPKLRTMMWLNPITSIIEAVKYGLLGVGELNWAWLGYSFAVMCLILLAGIAVFNRTQKSFMDTV